ncbi:hypothetical protein SARC_17731, partial [Sphaeroforma arctica JP610]
MQREPKWFKRPAGALFGYGGKLVTFSRTDGANVKVLKVTTDTDLVSKATNLSNAMAQGNFVDFCQNKALEASAGQNRE